MSKTILKSIAYQRYAIEIYAEYFASIKDVKDLAYLHHVSIADERLVIGTGWFLCYTETDYFVEILEWVSMNNGNKFQQTIEMINTLKKIFLQNKENL